MKRRRLPWPLLLACASPHLRGADSVAPEKEPRADVRTTLLPTDCRDERGVASASPDVELLYFEPPSGPPELLERRSDYDSVLVHNSYEAGGARIFAYVSSDAEHPDVLHRVRLDAQGTQGELTLSREFELRETAKGFSAAPHRITLRCALAPLQREKQGRDAP